MHVRQHRFNIHGLYDVDVRCNVEQICHELCPSTGQRMLDLATKEMGIKTNKAKPDKVDDLVP